MDENVPSRPARKSFPEDVQLFACRLIDEKVLDFNQFDRLVELAPGGAALIDFAQLIIDSDLCEDLDKVQAVMEAAMDDHDAGKKPDYDPFDTGEDEYLSEAEAFADATGGASSKPASSEQPTVAEPPSSQEPELEPDREDEWLPTPSQVADAEDIPGRKRIPLPKKKPSGEDGSADAKPEKISFQPKEPIAIPEEPAPPAAPETTAKSEPKLAFNPGSSEPSKEAPAEAPPKQPIRLGKEKTETAAPAASASIPAAAKPESLEDVAAAAVEALSHANAAQAAVADLAHAVPASAESTAEKPNETLIAAAGAPETMPNMAAIPDGDSQAARSFMVSLLLYCAKNGYSDLHISASARPFARKYGEIKYLAETIISASQSQSLNLSLLSPQQLEYFENQQDYDFAIPFDSGHRFRTNLMQHKDGIAGTYRIIPDKSIPIEQLGFSEQRSDVLKKMLTYHNGLVLVTGPVGAGKTMTLASLVAEMNSNRTDHIICVEEPIEIVHSSNQCSVTQRGVGPHTNTFHSALKGALRQDPDIIVIGEMRDLETIEMAISASETGHLVIGTMHTSDASNTLNRLLDVFPPAQQPQIRAMVAESLKGIVCQRLLPAKGGGVVMACELLLNNLAVASLIREGKSQGLSNIMETGKRDGMILMDNSVLELYEAGKITQETARANIKNEVLLRQVAPQASAPAQAPEPAADEPKKRGFFRK